jgi:hypothetical protein
VLIPNPVPAVLLSLLGSLVGHPQPPAEGTFVVMRQTDTLAVEQYDHAGNELRGTLVLPSRGRERQRYHVVLAPDGLPVLVEVSAWRGDDPTESPPRQRTRVIFKDDSVSVDDLTPRGMVTLVLPTVRGAIPYLNLSFGLLEEATVRAARQTRDSLPVPFFNLGGGQTVIGAVKRVGRDSALVSIGTVEFHLQVDTSGRLLGGGIPAQQLTFMRSSGGS